MVRPDAGAPGRGRYPCGIGRISNAESPPTCRPADAMHYLLLYELAPDYLEKRGPLRAEHLALAWAAHQRGELVLAGALADPVDGAVLLFEGDSPRAAEAFAAADPYVGRGLVRSWKVRPWSTVVGATAAVPTGAPPDAIPPR